MAGFTKPDNLPGHVPFVSLGNFLNYPIQRWSDGLIRYLELVSDELIIILLEDYWLMRPINRKAVYEAANFMLRYPDTIRFDLTSDRMFSKEARYAGYYDPLDIVSAKGQYSLSFQASIYRRKMLLEMLKPGETPWQVELQGTERINKSPYQVVGSYQWPINYCIVVNKSQFDKTGGWMFPARTLTGRDWNELDSMGYTTKPEEGNREHAL